MKRTAKLTALFMSIVLVAGLMPAPALAESSRSLAPASVASLTAQSTITTQGSGIQTKKTVEEAIAWAKSKVGSRVDSGQCVAFVKAYYAYLGMDVSKVWGNGKDYASNYCFGWSRVKGGTPQKGDILVYSSSTNGYGHVAICESATSIYEQNYNNCLKVQHHTWKYNSSYEPGYWGYIRPNWKSSAPKASTIANGTYTIRMNSSKSKTLDVYYQSKDNGANVHLWAIHNKPSQQWKFTKQSNGSYTIQNVNSGKFLEVRGGSKASGANVQQWVNNGGSHQRWYVCDMGGGSYALRNVGSGLYLDISGAKTADGTNIQQYSYNGGNAQKFKLQKYTEIGTRTTNLATGYYAMLSACDKSYGVDYYGGNTANGTNVQLYSSTQNGAQVFRFAKQSDGTYRISAKASDSAVFDVYDGSLNDCANVRLFQSNNTPAQRWILRSCGNGLYALQNVMSGKFLDVRGAKAGCEVNVQQYVGHNSNAQKFYLVPWDKSMSGSRTTVAGVSSSYKYTGRTINPSPTVKWRVNSLDSVRLPDSGTAPGACSNRRIANLEAGKTYVVEIDKATRLSGNAANAQLRALDYSGKETASRAKVKWSASKQTFTIKPKASGRLHIYPGIAEFTKGCAAQFTGVRVYEKLTKNVDYTVSYLNSGKKAVAASKVKAAGTYHAVVTGKGAYSGTAMKTFKVAK